MNTNTLSAHIATCAQEIEHQLLIILSDRSIPPRLLAAMQHGALNGGKRLRPFLLRATADIFSVPQTQSLLAGSALECVHCYSLVHDDLPDMDNDELRRGKPTVWKAFDPALAILAGDALLTQAFVIISSSNSPIPATLTAPLIAALAQASGAAGMVGGQVIDIEGETSPLSVDDIIKMQSLKTGALILAAVQMGAILGNASVAERSALETYARAAGIAFQLADDILDVTATSAELGKTAGKDVDQNKSTLVARLGLEAAQHRLDQAVEEGVAALAQFGEKADQLRALIQHFAQRTY